MRNAWLLVVAGCGSSPSSEPPPDPDAAVPVAHEDVATGLDEPWALAVDATHVYVTQRGGGISRVPKAGGTVAPFAVALDPASLDASTDRLCWVNTGTHAQDFRDGSVRCAPKSGGTDIELSPSYFPSALAIDGTTLYWVEIDGERVRAIDLDGSGAATLDASPTAKIAVALSPTKLVWTASGAGDDVVLVDRASGARTVLSTAEYAPGAVRIDGDDVYWVTRHALSDNGAIRRWRDGQASDLVSEEYWPSELVLVDAALYWKSQGRIRGFVDGAVETVVADRGAIGGLVSDGEYLYWTEPDRGAIVRLRRGNR